MVFLLHYFMEKGRLAKNWGRRRREGANFILL
jgi:hypothetical protein